MKVFQNRIKSFTIIELVTVITIIWILILSTTIYLGWFDEKRTIIEWQWCANTLWGKMTNFVFYALTSKNLVLDNDTIPPDYYYVSLTWASTEWENCTKDSTSLCDTIVFSISTWENPIVDYETFTSKNTCHGSNSRLNFYRSWTNHNEIENVRMNKWFAINENHPNDKNVFILSWWSTQQYLWDIIILACINSDCTDPKEIAKFLIDWRSQTISTRNCKFYDDEDPTKCKTREGCTVYSGNDPTVCMNY